VLAREKMLEVHPFERFARLAVRAIKRDLRQRAGRRARGELAGKAKLLHSCVILIAELRGSLDLDKGGALARNLRDLYEYMTQRLLIANVRSDASCLTEVLSLLGEIRNAWVAIGPQVRTA